MRLPWRQAGEASSGRQAGARDDDAAAQSCPGLARALERVLKLEQPRILDLGPLCGDSIVRLAERGARVSVEEFEGPPPTPTRKKGDDSDPPPSVPLKIEQDDASFDLVLVWEHADFVPPDRLRDLGGEIHRVLAPGGFVLLFASNAKRTKNEDPGRLRPARYRVLDDLRVVREESGGRARPRWAHPNREIERALAPLSIQGVQLQRDQTREFLARRKEA